MRFGFTTLLGLSVFAAAAPGRTVSRARTSLPRMMRGCGSPPRSMSNQRRQLIFTRAGVDPTTAKSIYEFKAELLDGTVQDMSEYKGKVLLIENVATL